MYKILYYLSCYQSKELAYLYIGEALANKTDLTHALTRDQKMKKMY